MIKILAILITLTFQPPTGPVTGYKVDLGKTTGAVDLTVPATVTANKIQIDVDLNVYKFLKVRAVNGVATGAPSAEVSLAFPLAPLVSSVQAN